MKRILLAFIVALSVIGCSNPAGTTETNQGKKEIGSHEWINGLDTLTIHIRHILGSDSIPKDTLYSLYIGDPSRPGCLIHGEDGWIHIVGDTIHFKPSIPVPSSVIYPVVKDYQYRYAIDGDALYLYKSDNSTIRYTMIR